MFYFVGLGLKPKHLSTEALEVLKNADAVYVETYTSSYSEGKIEELEKLIGKKVFKVSRKQVEEDSRKLLLNGKKNNVAFCVFGDVFFATTHIQLLIEAKDLGVKTYYIPSASIQNILGFTGLSAYKFGETVSIVKPSKLYKPEGFFEKIEKNFSNNLHTLCLLDIDSCLSIKDSMQFLEKIAKKKKKSFLGNAVLVGISGAFSGEMQIKAGKLKELKNFSFYNFPQCLVVCAKLSEKEEEALKKLYSL